MRLVEQVDPKKIWRTAVAKSAELERSEWGLDEPINTPIEVWMTFLFPRPKKPMFDVPASRKAGDIDKLQRNVFDAMQDAKVIKDDALAVDVCVKKRYVESDELAGVYVQIRKAAA